MGVTVLTLSSALQRGFLGEGQRASGPPPHILSRTWYMAGRSRLFSACSERDHLDHGVPHPPFSLPTSA